MYLIKERDKGEYVSRVGKRWELTPILENAYVFKNLKDARMVAHLNFTRKSVDCLQVDHLIPERQKNDNFATTTVTATIDENFSKIG
jgi:hypothetical protein